MKILYLIPFITFLFFNLSYAAEVGKSYEVSKTLDFYNPVTKKSIKVDKRTVDRPYYLKVLESDEKKVKVLIVDKRGVPIITDQPLLVWRTYFDKGVYQQAIDLIETSKKLTDTITHPPGESYCSKCDEEIKRKEKQQRVKYSNYKKDVDPIFSNKSRECRYFSKYVNAGVPKDILQQALTFYRKNKSKFKKPIISMADYSANSKNKRFYIVNLETGEVQKHKVSHGSGYDKATKLKYGDLNHDGMIDRCQNPKGSRSNMTRPGFFKTAELYWSNGSYSDKKRKYTHRQEINYKKNSHGKVISRGENLTYGWPTIKKRGSRLFNGLRMDGLSGSINDHARTRGVVMHGAYYNKGSIMGRSYGCPAFTPQDSVGILNLLTGGSLYYSSVPACASDMKTVLKQVKGWQKTCQ